MYPMGDKSFGMFPGPTHVDAGEILYRVSAEELKRCYLEQADKGDRDAGQVADILAEWEALRPDSSIEASQRRNAILQELTGRALLELLAEDDVPNVARMLGELREDLLDKAHQWRFLANHITEGPFHMTALQLHQAGLFRRREDPLSEVYKEKFRWIGMRGDVEKAMGEAPSSPRLHRKGVVPSY